jgi:rod shape-determining protein MreC
VGVFALLKRYQELLLVAALLLVPLVTFFSHAKQPAEPSGLDRVVLALASPVEKAVSWTFTGVASSWRRYLALRGAREEAVGLRSQLEALELERRQLLLARDENGRLQKLLGMAQARPDRRYLGARVIGVRLDPKGLQLVTLDRGSSDGVARMMPVVTAEGVVGRVHSVYGMSADVLVLVDRNSSIAVRVDRSRARANVRGIGDPDVCRLDYALRSEDLIEGDLLVTSGTDGVFPRGLPVGKVTRVKRLGYGLFQLSDVVPAVDVTKVEEVLVMTSWERPVAEAPAARVVVPRR